MQALIIHLLGCCCLKRGGLALTKWPGLLPGYTQFATRDRTTETLKGGRSSEISEERSTLQSVVYRTKQWQGVACVIKVQLLVSFSDVMGTVFLCLAERSW